MTPHTYGDWVDLPMGDEIICRVLVWCDPETPTANRQAIARAKLEMNVLATVERPAQREEYEPRNGPCECGEYGGSPKTCPLHGHGGSAR